MQYYLGIDGGATKTLAVIADAQGHVVARGLSGCGNHQLGADIAGQHIGEAVSQALARAGLETADIAAACYGLAGADRAFDYRILRPLCARVGIERHTITCDTIIALRAGTPKPYGAVSICGTGTNCAAINPAGETLQVGGFGYVYGDFGGGGDLGPQAFRAAIRAWEGRGPQTLLVDALLSHFGMPDMDALYNDALDKGYYPSSQLAPLLFQVAPEDEVAREILMRQGVELGDTVAAAVRRLGMGGDEFDVVLAGSIITRGDRDGLYVRRYMDEVVKKAAPKATLVALKEEPALGAVVMAMELGEGDVSPEAHERLRAQLAI